MQRSRLDLPDPEAPMRVTTSCSPTRRSTERSTVWLPKRFTTPSHDSTGTWTAGCSGAAAVTAPRSPAGAGSPAG